MKTNTTLYLTADESAVFFALPESLREGWTVEVETGVAYEDVDVLKVRAGMARFETAPELREYIQKALRGEKVDPRAITDMPEHVLPEFFFTIGAVGVTLLLHTLLKQTATDEDVAGVAGFSHIRHDILQTNASITLA